MGRVPAVAGVRPDAAGVKNAPHEVWHRPGPLAGADTPDYSPHTCRGPLHSPVKPDPAAVLFSGVACVAGVARTQCAVAV